MSVYRHRANYGELETDVANEAERMTAGVSKNLPWVGAGLRRIILQILVFSRSGVSSAAGQLQTKGLIHYARGQITLIDPGGLEALSSECYRILSRTMMPLPPSDKFGYRLTESLSDKLDTKIGVISQRQYSLWN